MKSVPCWASLAIVIFAANSAASQSTCPSVKLLRFGNTLSSMHTAAAPARWYSSTMRTTLFTSPKPESQSAMTGSVLPERIDRSAARKSVMVRMLASGTPCAAEIPRPLAQSASMPSCSASRAPSPSWTPKIRHTPPRAITALS